MPENDPARQRRVLDLIDVTRDRVAAYVDRTRPSSTRLSTISIVSSAIAAALTAGPAAGGEDFATTVQEAFNLPQSEIVWRTLCLAAALVAIVAAIAANLNKANDLSARITLAEECAVGLAILRNRVEFGVLAASDALDQYDQILARLPFVGAPRPGEPAVTESDPARGRRRDWFGASLVAVIVVAVLLVALSLVGLLVGLLGGASPAATASAPAAVASSVYAGRSDDGRVALAVAMTDGAAAAYASDGRRLEAWLQGSVDGRQVTLTGLDGAALRATAGGQELSGLVRVAGTTRPFSLRAAARPAGIYQARNTVAGRPVRTGWIILPDGTQVGVSNVAGTTTSAPRLDGTGRFVLGGSSFSATPVDGDDAVVDR